MTTEVTVERQPLSFSRVALYGLIAIVGSIVANLIVRAIGLALVEVSTEFNPLASAMATVLFTGGFVLIAVIVFAIVDRVSSNPVRMYNIMALIALILSLIPDIGMLLAPENVPFTGITFGAVMILMIMHVVAYAITVYVLTVLAYRE